MLGDVGNFIGRHGELDPNSKTGGEVQTRQMTICLFREPLRIQGQPPQLDSRRALSSDGSCYYRCCRCKASLQPSKKIVDQGKATVIAPPVLEIML